MMLSNIKSPSMAPETRSMSHQAKDLAAAAKTASAASASPAPTSSDTEADELHERRSRQDTNSVERDVESPPSSVRGAVDVEGEDQVGGGRTATDVNNSDTNNNNNTSNSTQSNKRSQSELLDIVEVSRKRRLSKDSADSLTGFIRWSFGHSESPAFPSTLFGSIGGREGDDERADEADELEEPPEWSTENRDSSGQRRAVRQLQASERLLRQHAKFGAGAQTTSGATNLTLVGRNKQQVVGFTHINNNNNNGSHKNNNQLGLGALPATGERQALKRSRDSGSRSPELSKFGANDLSRKQPASYLGSVVDRLHQRNDRVDEPSDSAVGSLMANGLSHQLQQFLQQQQQQQQQQRNSVEDLSPSANMDEGGHLALAAAIHRALIDSVGPNGSLGGKQSALNGSVLDSSKSTASSTGSSGSGQSTSSANQQGASATSEFVAAQKALMAAAAASGNMHLVETLNRQRRSYNTRSALHPQSLAGTNGANLLRSQMSQLGANHHQISSSSAANLSLNHRLQQQQQRHAQAAAALSALASAANQQGAHLGQLGAHNQSASMFHQQQQHHQANSHHLSHHANPFAANLSVANLASGLAQQQSHLSPMVEFKCDTCPSSFDDRHRLMQHQSIHLELKKDWFTETPVDEVMKIFNRRRGEFLCNICNLRFEATLDYDQHNHQVHGPRPYCCQFCGNGTRTFKCWRQYLNHLYDHRYIFSCTIDDCDFTVNRRDSLRFHIFRFHLNCQLPQNQTNVAGHQLQAHGHLQRSSPLSRLGFSRSPGAAGAPSALDIGGANGSGNKWSASAAGDRRHRAHDDDDLDNGNSGRDEDDDDDDDVELVIASGPNDKGEDTDSEMNVAD